LHEWWESSGLFCQATLRHLKRKAQKMSKLHIIDGPLKGQSFDLETQPMFIGRSPKNDIQIKDGRISRKQSKIFRIGDKFFIEDLRSTNGTCVNGRMITPGESHEVSEKDTISMADTVMRLEGGAGGQARSENAADEKEEKTDTMRRERRARSPKTLELVSRVSDLLGQSLSIQQLMDRILECLLEALPRIDRVAILLFDHQKGQLKEIISKAREQSQKSIFYYSRAVVDRVLQQGQAIAMSNISNQSETSATEGMKTLKIGSVLCVPMISYGKVLGAIYADSIKGPFGFREEDRLLLKSVSGSVAVAVEKAMITSRLEKSLTEIRIIR
jgi:sigma-B regulation protein RsbU (phosphoserine phosphatase)